MHESVCVCVCFYVHNVGHTTRSRLASAIDIDSCGHEFLSYVSLNKKYMLLDMQQTSLSISMKWNRFSSRLKVSCADQHWVEKETKNKVAVEIMNNKTTIKTKLNKT